MREVGASFDGGDKVNVSSVRMSLHMGSHTDAPGHTLSGGASIDQVDLSCYLGPCEVIELRLPPKSCILPNHLSAPIRAPRVLFKTSSYPDRERFSSDFVALSPELVEHLKVQGCVLVGIDTPSVDPFDAIDLKTHHALAARGIVSLEGLVLDRVEPGLYTLVALPLTFEGGDGSPVRAVLLPP